VEVVLDPSGLSSAVAVGYLTARLVEAGVVGLVGSFVRWRASRRGSVPASGSGSFFND
jgi:hypothetical protein